MREIKLGKVNDAKLYVMLTSKGFVAVDNKDIYATPTHVVYYDSGVYPVANLEDYICNKLDVIIKED